MPNDEGKLPELTEKELEDVYGPCASGMYGRKETVLYRDPGDMSGIYLAGIIVWIVPGPIYIVRNSGTIFNYIPEENIADVVRELSPVG
jgi:hypothetical protein